MTTRIVGPDDAATTCVLLHGFGVPGDDLVALAADIAAGTEITAEIAAPVIPMSVIAAAGTLLRARAAPGI